MKKSYRVTHTSGAFEVVETTGGIAAAIGKSGFPRIAVVSAVQMHEPGMSWEYLGEGRMKLTFESGAVLAGTEEQVNPVIAVMGFKPLAIRRNIVGGLPYIEPKSTPGYLSPASEAYWSM